MTKPLRISHSSKEMYITCPKKWELHYQEKLRSTKTSSPLFFGSAIDQAFNRILLDKKKVLTDEETASLDLSPEFTLDYNMTNVMINGEKVRMDDTLQGTYFKSDLDFDILEDFDINAIQEYADTKGISLNSSEEVAGFVEECYIMLKTGLDDNTQLVYNHICWRSLLRKGYMLINVYKQEIMPKIEEVFEIQKRVSISDGKDEFMGYIDVILSFMDEPGVKYIVDNKTSSRPYKDDSVKLSEQLAAYSEAEDIDKCAFIVVEKKLRKREPRVRCNIIKDTMPEETIDATFDKMTDVFHSVKEKKFDKDFDSCFSYGQKCAYYNNCRTGDLDNLKYLKEKDNG